MALDPERWLTDHGDAMYRVALLALRDPHRAEEAVQTALLAAWEARDRFQGQSLERTWLIGILRHKVADEWRRLARERSFTDLADATQDEFLDLFAKDGHWLAPPRDWASPERSFSGEAFLRALMACLDGLPERQVQVFLKRDLWGEDTPEVCKELDITPTNLWTTLHRARTRLRQCLERRGYDGPMDETNAELP